MGGIIAAPSIAQKNKATLGSRNYVLAKPLALSDWTASAPGAGNSITTQIESTSGSASSGLYVSGDLITSTLGNTNATTPNVLTYKNKIAFIGGLYSQLVTCFEFESSVSINNYAQYKYADQGVPTSKIYISVGAPNNTIVFNVGSGSTTVTPSNFDQSLYFRIRSYIVDSSITGGPIYFFLHYKDSVSLTEKCVYLGTSTHSANVAASQIIISHASTSASVGGTLTIARPVVRIVGGFVIGCSVDAGYGANWCPNPALARSFLNYGFSEIGDPAYLLDESLFGSDPSNLTANGGILNHAVGGTYVTNSGISGSPAVDMTTMAGYLAPIIAASENPVILVGSATNSITYGQNNYSDQAALSSFISTTLTAYTQIISSIVSANPKSAICCQGVDPRYDATVTGAPGGVARFRTLALGWNASLSNVCAQFGAAFSNSWADLEDANNPGQLLPKYDCGDHVHGTYARYRLVSRSQSRAILLK